MPRRQVWLWIALLLATDVGCVGLGTDSRPSAPPPPFKSVVSPPATSPTSPATQALVPAGRSAVTLPPLLLHIPGVGGELAIDHAMVRGFVNGGFTGVMQIYDWTGGNSGIAALRNEARNRQQASKIAAALVARHALDPSSKVYLTCHSGGAGLAVWALEDLPPTVTVESVILMSPALSPTYDLTKALRHVTGHAYVFFSESDNIVLGLGTRTFGTIDGIRVDAAGRVGFRQPPSADPAQYAKLISFPYDPAWVRYYNYGDHVGGMTRAFAGHVLAPLLLSGVLPPTATPSPVTQPQPTGHPQ